MRTLLFVVLSLFASTSLAAKELVFLYTYHKKPPFIVSQEQQQGLYYELAEALSSQSEHYQFKTVYVPRKRLDRMVNDDEFSGVVIGVSPIWFKDKHEEKYLWTQGFYFDKDEFVSLKQSPFEYKNSDSLNGKVLGSVAGHYYYEVNEGVKNGTLQRIDTVGELEVLKLIEKKRVHMGLVSESVFKYLKKQGEVKDIFHFSDIAHDEFVRRAFTTKKNEALYQEVDSLLSLLLNSGQLTELISHYE